MRDSATRQPLRRSMIRDGTSSPGHIGRGSGGTVATHRGRTQCRDDVNILVELEGGTLSQEAITAIAELLVRHVLESRRARLSAGEREANVTPGVQSEQA